MNPDQCRERLASARVARLATIADSGPHLVPIVFAVSRDVIYTAVDAKPKRSDKLKRLANIDHNPAVAILADHYEEDWDALWWVRADGVALVHRDPSRMAKGLDQLAQRYPQYRSQRPAGPLIEISVANWTGWSATR